MLAKGRAINSLKSDRVPQQGAHLATTKQQQQQQQQILRENQQRRSINGDITGYLDEPLPGGKRNKQQVSNESESTHTSSASSSGYLSHIGVINSQHYHNGSKAHTEQRSGSQLAPYHTNSVEPQQFHAHQLIFGDEREVSARMMLDKKIGNALRQVTANGGHNTNHTQQFHQQHHHPHQHQHQHQYPHQHQHHHRHLSDESGRFRTLVAPSMAVPMMIDDELDDSDGVDIDVDVDVDGNHLIDDDIDRRLADERSNEGGNALDEDNIAASNTISAFDPHALYGIPANGLRNQSSRESDNHQRRRRRPLVALDCVDSTLALLKNVGGYFQHPNWYNQQHHHQSVQVKPTAQNGDSNNNQVAQYQQQPQHHHVIASTRHSIQTDAQTRLVYNPLSTATTYQVANNSKQPTSLVYQPPQQQHKQSASNVNSLADQYHSFSYHQPAQQLQLASLNQHQIQYPAYYSQQLSATAQSAPVSERGAGSGSASASSASSGFSPNARRELEKAESKNKTKANSSKSKEGKKMQQGGSRQQLGSPADQPKYQHHSSGSHRKTGATSRKQPAGSNRSSSQSAISKHDRGSALSCCGKMAKLLLFITNILFWSAGVGLFAWGIYCLVDDHKYNLSQLLIFEPSNKMSLFQLLSWSFITLGCAAILVGFCGCSAILKNNRWILGLYIFLILAIFALDLATGLLAIIFQEKLVANVRLRLINKLRSEYGVQASFTAAIDYIQTKFECCGLEGHFDYDQSLWRLQRLGGFEATVARTCCHLRNSLDDQAYINPRPVNESMCQSTDVRFHQSYRYRKGCLDDLERMVRQKIWTFTIGCGAVGGVILLSLLFATCFCRSIPSQSKRKSSTSNQQQQPQQQQHPSSNHHHDNKTVGLTLAQRMDAQQQRHYR